MGSTNDPAFEKKYKPGSAGKLILIYPEREEIKYKWVNYKYLQSVLVYMMRKSNRMIMFAVIAAIIVAVPISLYGLSQKSVPIIATDGEAYANYSMNCTISTTPPMCLGAQVAQANISENSSRTSSFALGASGYLFYVGNSHAGAYHISLNLNLTGIFYSYLNPKNLTLSYIGSGTGNELCAFFWDSTQLLV